MDRIQLDKLIKANNVEDVTEEIRAKKHSDLIRRDVVKMIELKKKYSRLNKSLETIIMKNCSFLFMNYTDIYNKVYKDEIDLNILGKFLDILKKIEVGSLDQHEGAYEVGKLLKEMYIDCALKKAEKIEKKNTRNQTHNIPHTSLNSPKNITWKQYKEL